MLKFNTHYFAADTGGEGGANLQADDAGELTGADAGTDAGANAGTDTGKSEVKGFTQKDVNNIAAREAKEAQEKVFRELGIEDFENAKEGMQKFREWQESQKTDAERKEEKLTQLEQTHLQAQEENATLKAQLDALKAGVVTESVDDVVVLAKNLVNDEVAMDAAIAQVLEKYPHFAQKQADDAEVKDKSLPSFSTGKHSSNSGKEYDPFKARLAKYK